MYEMDKFLDVNECVGIISVHGVELCIHSCDKVSSAYWWFFHSEVQMNYTPAVCSFSRTLTTSCNAPGYYKITKVIFK